MPLVTLFPAALLSGFIATSNRWKKAAQAVTGFASKFLDNDSLTVSSLFFGFRPLSL